MEISKVTLNFAKKHNISIQLVEGEEEFKTFDRLWFFLNEDDCEPDFSYLANPDGSFSFNENLSLPQQIKEELPAFIQDEKALRMMLAFVADESK